MQKRILIIGSGFAGTWSALAAMRVLDRERAQGVPVEVAVVAPRPALVIRPRLYEEGAAGMWAPLQELFAATGIRYIEGQVETIGTDSRQVELLDAAGVRTRLHYDKLIIASGSRLFRPDILGLKTHAFSVDQIDEAAQLEAHCHRLAELPPSEARNTVVIVGGGFTGIELAAEMPARLAGILGNTANLRVIVIEQAASIGPELGPGPRPVIQQALGELGVQCRLGTSVVAIDQEGLTTSAGERIASKTVVWTAGMRASPLAQQLQGAKDGLGRLHVDRNLKVPSAEDVFATGDVAYAATDDQGNHALMSCQHAMSLGRSAGHNAAAELMGVPCIPYTQPKYVTCLDLGPWGAVLTEGWGRTVKQSGAEVKSLKRFINGQYIYPPKADRASALAEADPARTVDV